MTVCTHTVPIQVEEADSLIAAVDTAPIAGTAAAPEEHAARAAAAAAAAASTAFRSFVVTGGNALYFRVDAQYVSKNLYSVVLCQSVNDVYQRAACTVRARSADANVTFCYFVLDIYQHAACTVVNSMC
jgi:hypothetical protein